MQTKLLAEFAKAETDLKTEVALDLTRSGQCGSYRDGCGQSFRVESLPLRTSCYFCHCVTGATTTQSFYYTELYFMDCPNSSKVRKLNFPIYFEKYFS